MNEIGRTTGTVTDLFSAKDVSANFSKREFVIEWKDGEYANINKFQCINATIPQLDNVSEGDKVEIDWKLSGRTWANPRKGGALMYFTTLTATSVKVIETANAQRVEAAGEDDDDLPF